MSDQAITAAHEHHDTLKEDVLYPEHVQRTESSEFRKGKHNMVHEMDLGCWICGSREKREVHHFLCEWALWQDVDPDKVLEAARLFDPYGFTRKDPDTPISSPDDQRNLMVLCEKHHRAPYYGVHMLSMNIWIAQRIAKDGVQITRNPEEERGPPATVH